MTWRHSLLWCIVIYIYIYIYIYMNILSRNHVFVLENHSFYITHESAHTFYYTSEHTHTHTERERACIHFCAGSIMHVALQTIHINVHTHLCVNEICWVSMPKRIYIYIHVYMYTHIHVKNPWKLEIRAHACAYDVCYVCMYVCMYTCTYT